MTTYREIIYMCLDLLKGMSDDFTYTEEHIAYLLDKYRAFLLKQKYMNEYKKPMSNSNYQNIQIKISNLSVPGERVFKSDEQLPNLLDVGITKVISNDYYDIHFEFVSKDRFPFVGNNKYLKRFWYCCIDNQNYLNITSSGTRYFLGNDEKPLILTLTGVFESPKDVFESNGIDYLDKEFPLEDALISTLIEMVVKVLSSSIYKPEDDINNAKDDLSTIAAFLKNNLKSDFQKKLE